ncbi:MAG: right-handed parallel beta-helix repeat-containing protein [Planctomycetes bacterium]|nr:right-handed parallel beta-helix repeat-containing protein [Planctomycetota bacterium]
MRTLLSLTACVLLLFGMGQSSAQDYYVIQTEGASDENSGLKESPWKTIAHAAATAKAGDTVHIGKGIYRDNLKVMNSGTKDNPITFMAMGDGQVLISGADVIAGFKKEGNLWVIRPWKVKFGWYWGDESTYPEVANPNCPFMSAARRENIFINGVPLQWVPNKQALAPGRFYWNGKPNSNDGELLVWPEKDMDLSQETVEVPMRECVLSGPWGSYPRGISEVRSAKKENQYAKADWINIRNITFGYTNEGFVTSGAIISGDNWTLEDCVFEYMNAGGVWIGGDDAVLKRVTAQYNGKVGINGKFRVVRALLEDCISTHNNRKFYKIYWDAGGLKLHDARDTVVRNFITAFNFGSSLWYDCDCIGNRVENSLSFGNDGLGFFYEVSDKGTFVNNVSFGNGCGFMYAHSANGLIENNVVVGCSSGFILGGDRGKFKGVNTTFRNNIIMETRGHNVGWKWSKNPDGRSQQSKNMITQNLFASIYGNKGFEMYKTLPGLAEFESEYKNGFDNHQIRGLEEMDTENRSRLNASMRRTLEGVRAVEPRFNLNIDDAKLTQIWELGAGGNVGGYWISTTDGPVLVLVINKKEVFSLMCEGECKPVLWEFHHLGKHRINPAKAYGKLYTFESEARFAIITGLPAGTVPLKGLLQVKASKDGKPTSEIIAGETAQISVTVKNIFSKPVEFSANGIGLDKATFTLDAGQIKNLEFNASPVGGTRSLTYKLHSEALGAPYQKSIPLNVVRKVKASGTGSQEYNISVDTEEQRDATVWDETTGDKWKGKADVSAQAAVTYNSKSMSVHVKVTDDKLFCNKSELGGGDGIIAYIDTRARPGLRSSKSGDGVYRIMVPASRTANWSDIPVSQKKPLVTNGDFEAGKNGWYIPNGSNVSIVTDHSSSYAHILGESVIQRDIKIKKDWKKLVLTAKVRYKKIIPGQLGWHCGRVVLDFKNNKGKHAGGWPEMMDFKGTQEKWITLSKEYEIPAEAETVRLQAGMWSVKGGELDVDEITLAPVTDNAGEDTESIRATGKKSGSGYEIRLTIPAGMFQGAGFVKGREFGFNLAVCDSDRPESKEPETRLFWNGNGGSVDICPNEFGLLILE